MRVGIEDFKKEFEPMVVQKMSKGKIPGSAFTIFEDEEIIYSRGFGSRNLQKALPFTPDTVNGFGSNTKSFTALAIMLLQEEGKLSVEDPISKYIPITLGRENQPIKIKHLLSHSSGIPNLGNAEITSSRSHPDKDTPIIPFSTWDDVFFHINGANAEIRFKPGEHFYYFNNGFMLLGEIVARVSGMNYEDFVKERIFKKIGMDRSGYLQSDFEQEDNISVPYDPDPKSEDQPVPIPIPFLFNKFVYPAGGLLSSTNEMAKYIMMMMNNGKIRDKQVFNPDIISELITSRIIGSTGGSLGEVNYCYGWNRVENFLGDTLILHGGGITGGFSQMAYLKNAKIGITSMNNFPPAPDESVFMAFCYLLDKDPEDVFPYIKRNKHLAKLTGNYSSYMDIGKRKVVLNRGWLTIQNPKTKIDFPLFPKSDKLDELNYYIQLPFGKLDVDFEIDSNNNVHVSIERNLFHKK